MEFTENITQFDHITEENDKKQILLCHTSRPLKFYLKSINYRLNNQFDRVPHYLISEKGGIIKNYSERKYSNFMLNPNIDKNVIIVCLENLGWLRYKEKEDKYVNWVGDEYNGEWENSKRHGEGTLFDKNKKEIYSGQWVDDKKADESTSSC